MTLRPPALSPDPALGRPLVRQSVPPRVAWATELASVALRYSTGAYVGLLAALAGMSALIATRFGTLVGRLVYNYDSPVDFFLPSLFHQSLREGRLPLWSDKLGLGFPLYAEGKIAAFYPPHWLIYQLPALDAVQVTLLMHLVFLGLGTALLVRSLSNGQRSPAIFAAAAIPLVGGLVAKLEWTNMVEAFAWLPWILLPLLRHGAPTRRDIALGGMAWGAQALLGHPNVWLLSGLTAFAVLISSGPFVAGVRRTAAFVIIGGGIGAVQLIPTVVLLPLSDRASGLGAAEFFAYPGGIFDALGFAFANVFVGFASTSNLNETWYPSGGWGILEAGAYVGLPVLALAMVGLRSPRAVGLAAISILCVVGPLLWALHPDWLASVPLLNLVRRPTRAYMFADFALVVGAALALGQIRQQKSRWRPSAAIVGVTIGAYVVLAGLSVWAPGLVDWLRESLWPYGSASTGGVPPVQILTAAMPVVAEVVLGLAAVAIIRSGVRSSTGLVTLGAMAIVPMALLTPSINQLWGPEAFDRSSGPFISALRAAAPHRVLTLNPPTWFDGTPDQIQLAGISSLDMHSSLNLRAGEAVVAEARTDLKLAVALGVDTLVAFGAPCAGAIVAQDPADQAVICHLRGAVRPPYWLPSTAVTVDSDAPFTPLTPHSATVSVDAVIHDAMPVTSVTSGPEYLSLAIDAPADGWVFVDRSWWPFWSIKIDGKPASALEAWSGQLIKVSAGPHHITEVLEPLDAGVGLVVGLATALVALVWVRRDAVHAPQSPPDGSDVLP